MSKTQLGIDRALIQEHSLRALHWYKTLGESHISVYQAINRLPDDIRLPYIKEGRVGPTGKNHDMRSLAQEVQKQIHDHPDILWTEMSSDGVLYDIKDMGIISLSGYQPIKLYRLKK